MSDVARRIADNLAGVRQRIAQAAFRGGRSADDVRLVAVTKGVPAELVGHIAAAGCVDVGESRPQELWGKAARLANVDVRWHMIGHLQRNKLHRTLPLVSWIHSIDSARLLHAVNEESRLLDRIAAVLLEVNISGDTSKTGLALADIEPLLADEAQLDNVAIHGLMGMAALEGGAAAARRDFAALRELRDGLAPRCPTKIALNELSMGMSGDFEIAIEEGATIVRIGSALFEGIAP